MQRKAAIYIRTSSKAQGEKASPREQENDCQLLAKEKGLTVFSIWNPELSMSESITVNSNPEKIKIFIFSLLFFLCRR